MKYVSYDLFWHDNGIGEQPYQIIGETGANFNGGIMLVNGLYYGTVEGTDEQCNNAIAICTDFKMNEITEAEFNNILSSLPPPIALPGD